MNSTADLATQVTLPRIVKVVKSHVQVVHGAVSVNHSTVLTHDQLDVVVLNVIEQCLPLHLSRPLPLLGKQIKNQAGRFWWWHDEGTHHHVDGISLNKVSKQS